jgi:hypothetical protein
LKSNVVHLPLPLGRPPVYLEEGHEDQSLPFFLQTQNAKMPKRPADETNPASIRFRDRLKLVKNRCERHERNESLPRPFHARCKMTKIACR